MMAKYPWQLSNEEIEKIMREMSSEAIAETHASGRPSTHGDSKGVYHLYPDGQKEYIKLYSKDYKADKPLCRKSQFY